MQALFSKKVLDTLAARCDTVSTSTGATMYHMDPIEDAGRYGDAEEAREELARKEHAANRDFLIDLLLRDSEHDVGYFSPWSGRKPYTASQHAIDQIEFNDELRRDLFKLIATCAQSTDHLLRLLSQSILARIGDGYADDEEALQ